jgi:hypothetical protein
LANTTVSHSQTVINQANTVGSAIASTVVKTAPISTMNMTGLAPEGARVELAQRAQAATARAGPGSSRPAGDPAGRLGALGTVRLRRRPRVE